MYNKTLIFVMFVIQFVIGSENSIRLYATGSVIGYIDLCG